MIHIYEEMGLDFDDVLLEPRISNCVSRDLIDVSVKTKNFDLMIPIISSPMVGVSSVRLIKELGRLGGIGILPRLSDMETRKKQILELYESDRMFGVAVGVRPEIQEEEYKLIEFAVDHGAKLICIDTANGYLKSVTDFAHKINKYLIARYTFSLMSGNVVTGIGVRNLMAENVDFVRVGIGSGSVCTTRNVTGVGSAQLTALQNCSYLSSVYMPDFKKITITADGGIRNSGDALKALTFGADVIMLGKLLAQTEEAENDGHLYGAASEVHQNNNGYKVKSVEGMNINLEEKIPLEKFIERFVYGIKSGCTYLGIKKLSDIRQTDVYVQRVNNSIKSWKQEWL
jgi:IMP dehydrogenase